MELRQLEYFRTVAEELHFGRAAERLHIVQSAVSQQIRRLERELGIALFDRSTRTVRLTEAGRRLLPEAGAVLAAAARARSTVADLVVERADTLRLGTSGGLGDRLERVLAEFATRAPGTAVELTSAALADRLAKVRSGALDAAFVRGLRHAPELRIVPVWRDELVVALPAAHPLAEGDVVEFAGLAGLPLRLTPRANNPPLVDLVLNSCRDAGFEPVLGPPFTTDQDTLTAIGVGRPSWTVFYAAQSRLLHVPRVVYRPVRNPSMSMQTALAVPRTGENPALADFLTACESAAH